MNPFENNEQARTIDLETTKELLKLDKQFKKVTDESKVRQKDMDAVRREWRKVYEPFDEQLAPIKEELAENHAKLQDRSRPDWHDLRKRQLELDGQMQEINQKAKKAYAPFDKKLEPLRATAAAQQQKLHKINLKRRALLEKIGFGDPV